MQGLAIIIGNIIGNSTPRGGSAPVITYYLITEASSDPMVTEASTDNMVYESAP